MFYSDVWFSTCHFAMVVWAMVFLLIFIDRVTKHEYEWINNAAMCIGMVALGTTYTLWE